MSDQIFDRTALLNRVLGDEDLAREVIAVFLGDIPNKIKSLWRAVDNRAASQMRDQAHAVKGAARNISAAALGDVGRRPGCATHRAPGTRSAQRQGRRFQDRAVYLLPDDLFRRRAQYRRGGELMAHRDGIVDVPGAYTLHSRNPAHDRRSRRFSLHTG